MPDFIVRKSIYSSERRRFSNAQPVGYVEAKEKLFSQSVVIDCGANIGIVSEDLALREAKVFSFEPNPFAYNELQKISKKYNCITAINAAVVGASKDGWRKLFFHKNSSYHPLATSTSSSLDGAKKNIDPGAFQNVMCINISKFIASLQCDIDILKMDVEGLELELLEDLSGHEVKDSDWLSFEAAQTCLSSIFKEIGKGYVPALVANYQNVMNDFQDWETDIDGARWKQRSFPYQAKCLRWINEEFNQLCERDQKIVRSFLSKTGCAALILDN